MTTGVRRLLLQSGRRGLAALLLASAGLAGSALYASAQYYDRDVEAVLSPRAVVWRLSRQGYTGLGHPRFDGTVYSVEAQSPWGNRVLLFVDARDGAIIDRERVEAPLYPPGRIGSRRPGYGWTEDEVEVRAPRPEPRYARAAPEGGVPTNPFASNLPSGPARPAEANANPYGINPDQTMPGRKGPERPRTVAKAVPPKAPSAIPPTKPVDVKAPPLPDAAATAAPGPAAVKPAETARAPEPATLPTPRAASSGRPAPEKPPADAAASEAPQRTVRVIGGVTPVQGATKSDDPKPATPSSAATE